MTWRKSSHSGANGAECVELAHAGTRVLVRDSKNPEGPALGFDPTRFAGFLVRLKEV